MQTMLLTDWVTIARSGPTADGRVIKAAWLEEMADAYDPDVYTAVINVEHRYGNLGTVRELRTRKTGGQTDLQARLRPNKYYLYNLDEESGIFFSVEITHDFAKSGKCYLTGLASTDSPASLGTTELHFSKDNQDVTMAEPVKVFLTPPPDGEPADGFMAMMKTALGDFFNKKTKETDMNEEQISAAINQAVEPVLDALAKLAPEKPEKQPEESADYKKLAADYSTLQAAHDALQAAHDALQADFNTYKAKVDEALSTAPQTLPAPDTGKAGEFGNLI